MLGAREIRDMVRVASLVVEERGRGMSVTVGVGKIVGSGGRGVVARLVRTRHPLRRSSSSSGSRSSESASESDDASSTTSSRSPSPPAAPARHPRSVPTGPSWAPDFSGETDYVPPVLTPPPPPGVGGKGLKDAQVAKNRTNEEAATIMKRMDADETNNDDPKEETVPAKANTLNSSESSPQPLGTVQAKESNPHDIAMAPSSPKAPEKPLSHRGTEDTDSPAVDQALSGGGSNGSTSPVDKNVAPSLRGKPEQPGSEYVDYDEYGEEYEEEDDENEIENTRKRVDGKRPELPVPSTNTPPGDPTTPEGLRRPDRVVVASKAREAGHVERGAGAPGGFWGGWW
ncbi:hypothetical protein M427DRAFT_367409 [Gonapodya prolifera JEL478]|uniref:Uncharacterized protein n=1 Tax=Gonapodya prolifera (strain JEL478) TaxID=1344416 RepID=A0A139A9V3_GONPJ|nr:hypothetical protein M427DRAFT_367409 [Gonapodya prolifera JEL478]|eukprot:KXS13459.1 hypothetical protein M427DRAFT_367409 [Gonapodya prolifera JEL478]